jgi:hypothetical protein
MTAVEDRLRQLRVPSPDAALRQRVLDAARAAKRSSNEDRRLELLSPGRLRWLAALFLLALGHVVVGAIASRLEANSRPAPSRAVFTMEGWIR